MATAEGWLYLAALNMALKQRRPAAGFLHHSDRGSQYASKDYQPLLARHQLQPSMSRRGNCYDNAPMESFFASLKAECIQGIIYPTRAIARADLFDYIELF